MLFNSLEFIFCFLPVVLALYTALRLSRRQLAAKWFLVAASLFFYGWWNPRSVPIIVASILANWTIGLVIERAAPRAGLALGVALNLGLLGYFKYWNFLLGTVDHLAGSHLDPPHIVLPLAISFFTFQQIAYLVEVARDRKAADSFLDYCLFVLFFPHLIAGPITHHKEMLPQFKQSGGTALAPAYAMVGTAIFVVGLVKKVVVADSCAAFANPVFAAADTGGALSAAAAWTGVLAYTFQLYFDFSGYSDMAIGLGLMFGIRLPANFASPYQATSIVDFWRRWHISLSRFLRTYLYIPLGGNRQGRWRRHLNLFATMAIGGLWHGAGWTFIGWGALHGLYLIINHAWRATFGEHHGRLAGLLGWALTFLAVVVAWVPFRATTAHGAMALLTTMAGAGSGVAIPSGPALLTVVVAAAMAFLCPNSLELAGYPASIPDAEAETAPLVPVSWRLPAGLTAVALGAAAALAVARLPDPGVFLYFNF